MQSVYSRMNYENVDYEDIKKYLASSTLNPYHYDDINDGSDIELDDTAPLPLLVGMGVTVFIGAIILILICCCCRRKRPLQPANGAPPAVNYQRAPVTDGGPAFPMTQMNAGNFQHTGGMGAVQQNNYGVIGQSQMPHPQGQFPSPTPHFGGVPTFPPNQYLSTLPQSPTPLSQPSGQAPSASQSSQASTVSGATADPLVPSSSPSSMAQSPPQQQQQQQQTYQPYFYNQQSMSQAGQPMMSQAGMMSQTQSPMSQPGHFMKQSQHQPSSGGDLPPPPGMQFLPFSFPSMMAQDHSRSAPSPPPYAVVSSANLTPVNTSTPYSRPKAEED